MSVGVASGGQIWWKGHGRTRDNEYSRSGCDVLDFTKLASSPVKMMLQEVLVLIRPSCCPIEARMVLHSRLSFTSFLLYVPPRSRALLCLHVSRTLNATLGILWHLRIEPLLDLLKHVLICLVADKADTQPLSTESTCTTDTVEV